MIGITGATGGVGSSVLPLGDGPEAPGQSLIARDDVARALAAAATSRTEGVLHLTGPVREGRFAAAPGDVERLTGTPPMPLGDFLRR